MADAVQPIQRNIYRNKTGELAGVYRDGSGVEYSQQLKKLSWPIASDLPTQAQNSARRAVAEGRYSSLHPMKIYQEREIDAPTFSETYGTFGIRSDGDPKSISAHERLFVPSKSLKPNVLRTPTSQAEIAADQAFSNGRFQEAIRQYTLGIAQKPSLFAYEKRCAAYAHIGKYKEALADAEFILTHGPPGGELPSARLRVKAISDFLTKGVTAPGHDHAMATLMCGLTPREHRQWRATPATYTRPYPFGSPAM